MVYGIKVYLLLFVRFGKTHFKIIEAITVVLILFYNSLIHIAKSTRSTFFYLIETGGLLICLWLHK